MLQAAAVVAATMTMMMNMVTGGQQAFLSYYGTQEDGYVGQHHGAYWHGDSCGLPDVVDDFHYGVAAPYSVPYCARMLVCLDGKCVIVTVVDRMKDDEIYGLPHLDVWPAVARELDLASKGVSKEGFFVILDD